MGAAALVMSPLLRPNLGAMPGQNTSGMSRRQPDVPWGMHFNQAPSPVHMHQRRIRLEMDTTIREQKRARGRNKMLPYMDRIMYTPVEARHRSTRTTSGSYHPHTSTMTSMSSTNASYNVGI